MSRRRDSLPLPWVVAVSLVAAMALRVLPLPPSVAWFNPDWVLLFLIYWILAAPDRVGLTTAWVTGFLADVLTARALGQHALGYVLVAYCCQRWHRQLRYYPVVQQSVSIGVLLFVGQLTVAWTQEFSAAQLMTAAHYWLPVLSGVLAWPWVMRLLHRMRSASASA